MQKTSNPRQNTGYLKRLNTQVTVAKLSYLKNYKMKYQKAIIYTQVIHTNL